MRTCSPALASLPTHRLSLLLLSAVVATLVAACGSDTQVNGPAIAAGKDVANSNDLGLGDMAGDAATVDDAAADVPSAQDIAQPDAAPGKDVAPSGDVAADTGPVQCTDNSQCDDKNPCTIDACDLKMGVCSPHAATVGAPVCVLFAPPGA